MFAPTQHGRSLALVLVLSLGACGPQARSTAEAVPAPSTQQAPAKPSLAEAGSARDRERSAEIGAAPAPQPKPDPQQQAAPEPAAPVVVAPREHPEPKTNAAIDALFVDYSGEGQPGAALMVIDHGQPVLVKTYGLARLDRATPVSVDTNFRLASLTKGFTAMAVLILADRGAVDLDASIRTYLPAFPAHAKAISVRHLLQHSSGLRSYSKRVTEVFPAQIHDRGVVELLAQSDSGYFDPGSEYRYSNGGYAALAVLVEEVSGQSFAAFLATNIFTPLGMDTSVAYERGVSKVSARALGYVVGEDRVINSDQSLYSAVLGDGGVYSSLADLYRWDQALYTNELVSAELRDAAFTPGLGTYGFGWRIDSYRGHRRVHHGGATCGFRNFIQRFIDDELTVVVLSNRARPEVQSLAEAVADLYLGS